MDTVITTLAGGSGITAASIFGVFEDIVPFLVVIVPVALGATVLRKLIKGAAKAKVRL